jgi:DNA-binding MarR family transcriptional regulator
VWSKREAGSLPYRNRAKLFMQSRKGRKAAHAKPQKTQSRNLLFVHVISPDDRIFFFVSNNKIENESHAADSAVEDRIAALRPLRLCVKSPQNTTIDIYPFKRNLRNVILSATARHLKQARAFASVEEEVFIAVQIVADRLMQPWAAFLRTVDLTPAQYNVLRILRGAGAAGLLAGEIGERLIARSPDVTRLIDRLEKRALVARNEDADDRRAVRVHITEPGLALIAPLDQQAGGTFKSVLSQVPPERLRALRDQLGEVLELLAT